MYLSWRAKKGLVKWLNEGNQVMTKMMMMTALMIVTAVWREARLKPE